MGRLEKALAEKMAGSYRFFQRFRRFLRVERFTTVEGSVGHVGRAVLECVQQACSMVVRDIIEPIRVTSVLALRGTSGRLAFVGESSRGGTGRTMLAMPISGGFGASRLSGGKGARCVEFETNHLLLSEPCCRSSCHRTLEFPRDERIRERLKAAPCPSDRRPLSLSPAA